MERTRMPAARHSLSDFYEQSILPRLTPELVYGGGIEFEPEAGGVRWRGSRCPICGDASKRGPFKVHSDHGLAYNCHACEAKGSPLSFLNNGQKPTGKRYVEILNDLAGRAGLKLPQSEFTPEQRDELNSHLDRKQLLGVFYGLARDAFGLDAGDYLAERGLNHSETLATFEVGYYDSAALRSKLTDAQLKTAKSIGLFNKKLVSHKWIVYPWRTASGEPLTAYFRRIDAYTPEQLADKEYMADNPKTYALPGDASKSVPFGMFQARNKANEYLVVEGPADVMACWRAGLKNTISYIAALPSAGQLQTLSGLKNASYTLLGDNDKVGIDSLVKSARKILGLNNGSRVYVANISGLFEAKEDPALYFENRQGEPGAALALIDRIDMAESYAQYIGRLIGEEYALAESKNSAKLKHAAQDRIESEAQHLRHDIYLNECLAAFQKASGLNQKQLALLESKAKSERSGAKLQNTQAQLNDESEKGPIDVLVNTDEIRVNDEVLGGLVKQAWVYQRDGELVEIKRDSRRTTFYIANVAKPRLRELITQAVTLTKLTAKGEKQLAHPPQWCVEALHCRKYWRKMKVLNGIIRTPVLRPDGSVLSKNDYDSATGLWYKPPSENYFANIPDRPTAKQVAEARDSLLDLVTDVPFESETDRAAWLCALLTPFARPAFDGPMPLNHVDANTPGSGKTLLLKVINAILTGEDMPTMSVSHDDTENEKRITSFLRQGSQIQVFDNVSGRFGGKSFDALLTSDKWQGRMLGTNDVVNCPNRTVVYSTGNNIQLLGDMHRRMLRIRLKSDCETPETRSDFKYDNLEAHARANRHKYVADCLTILRGFFVVGCPDHGCPRKGSYEGWSKIVRGAVVWCGMTDPAANCLKLSEEMGGQGDLLGSVITGWAEWAGIGEGRTGGEIRRCLVEAAQDHEDFTDAIRELCNLSEKETPKARTLVNRLAPYKDRVYGGLRLVLRKKGRMGKMDEWAVERVNANEKLPAELAEHDWPDGAEIDADGHIFYRAPGDIW